MQLLPAIFHKSGFTYTQLINKSPYYVYKQSDGSDITSYEVIKANQQKAGERFGKFYPERETYPSPETWGICGFTFPTKLEAENHLIHWLKKPIKLKKAATPK